MMYLVLRYIHGKGQDVLSRTYRKWFHVLRWREAYRRGSTGLSIFKMEGHPRMLLKIKDHRKFSWGYPRILFKIKCLAVLTHYLTEDKWLDNTFRRSHPRVVAVVFIPNKTGMFKK